MIERAAFEVVQKEVLRSIREMRSRNMEPHILYVGHHTLAVIRNGVVMPEVNFNDSGMFSFMGLSIEGVDREHWLDVA